MNELRLELFENARGVGARGQLFQDRTRIESGTIYRQLEAGGSRIDPAVVQIGDERHRGQRQTQIDLYPLIERGPALLERLDRSCERVCLIVLGNESVRVRRAQGAHEPERLRARCQPAAPKHCITTTLVKLRESAATRLEIAAAYGGRHIGADKLAKAARTASASETVAGGPGNGPAAAANVPTSAAQNHALIQSGYMSQRWRRIGGCRVRTYAYVPRAGADTGRGSWPLSSWPLFCGATVVPHLHSPSPRRCLAITPLGAYGLRVNCPIS